MGIPDPLLNCVLAVCCSPAGAQASYTRWLVQQGIDTDAATRCAAVTFEYFEFAPKGSLVSLKAEIARVAKA
jgi:hypothetical protein